MAVRQPTEISLEESLAKRRRIEVVTGELTAENAQTKWLAMQSGVQFPDDEAVLVNTSGIASANVFAPGGSSAARVGASAPISAGGCTAQGRSASTEALEED